MEALLRLTLLGTGTPTPSLKRASSGFVLEIGDETIVVDHGPGAHNRYLESGRHAKDCTHVFLTHYHYDHWLEYPRLMLTHWDQACGTRPELKVYGPPPLRTLHAKLFDPEDGIYAADLKARTTRASSQKFYEARGGAGKRAWPNPEITELVSGAIVETTNWSCKAYQVPHAQPALTNLAYRFECDEGSVVFAGDTGISDGFPDFCKDADVLIHMCYYVSGTNFYGVDHPEVSGHIECAKNGEAAQVKTLVGIHQTAQLDAPGVREKCIAEIKEIFGGQFIWGEDLMEIPITPIGLPIMD